MDDLTRSGQNPSIKIEVQSFAVTQDTRCIRFLSRVLESDTGHGSTVDRRGHVSGMKSKRGTTFLLRVFKSNTRFVRRFSYTVPLFTRSTHEEMATSLWRVSTVHKPRENQHGGQANLPGRHHRTCSHVVCITLNIPGSTTRHRRIILFHGLTTGRINTCRKCHVSEMR